MLQLCLSQEINDKPFTFPATGVSVFSFEEALFYVYNNWQSCIDDCTGEKMITWVSGIGHPFLVQKIIGLAKLKQESSRILGFLQLAPFFDSEEIAEASLKLEAWEKAQAWEKLKRKADNLVKSKSGYKGINLYKGLNLYKQALELEERPELLNNAAVACMKLGMFKEAIEYLQRATTLAPDNKKIEMHLAEAEHRLTNPPPTEENNLAIRLKEAATKKEQSDTRGYRNLLIELVNEAREYEMRP